MQISKGYFIYLEFLIVTLCFDNLKCLLVPLLNNLKFSIL